MQGFALCVFCVKLNHWVAFCSPDKEGTLAGWMRQGYNVAMLPMLFQFSFGFRVAIAQALVENYTRAAKKLETRSFFTCILFQMVLLPFRVLQLGFPRRDASSFRACITALHQRRLVRYQSWASLVETCQRVTSSDWTVTESQNRHRLPQIANGKSIATGKSLVSHCCQD